VGTEVYAVTANGGSLYSYNLMTRKTTYYGKVSNGRTIAKSFDYDPINNRFLIGVGIKADLVIFDLATKSFCSILPSEYADNTNFNSVKYVDGHFFVRAYPSKDVLVYKAENLELLYKFNSGSQTVSDKIPNEKAVIYSYNGHLYKFNYSTGASEKIDVPLGVSEVTTFHSIDIDNKKFLLMLLDNNGVYIKLDLNDFTYQSGSLIVSHQAVDYHALTSYKNGRYILGNGYLSGGFVSYDTITGKYGQLDGISQVESFYEMDDKLYIGAYPKGRVVEYDLTKQWNDSEGNPKEILRLENTGQTRPAAMTGSAYSKNLFIGFYPEDGIGGGSLAVYNTITQENQIYQNFIDNHSIVSLVNVEGIIYGGTSVFANGKKATDGAKFFRFQEQDPTNVEVINIPFDKRAMVTGLTKGFFGDIWGLADGYIFNYKPQTGESKVVKVVSATSGRYRNGTLIKADNGYIYGAVEGKFFRINPITFEVEILKNSNVYNLAKDSSGRIYYYDKSDLWYHQPSKLEYNDLLSMVDKKTIDLNDSVSDLEKSYRLNFMSDNPKWAILDEFSDNYNYIHTLQESDQRKMLAKLNKDYRYIIERLNKYKNLYNLINNRVEYYNENITKAIESGIIDDATLYSFQDISREIEDISNAIQSVYRLENRKYLIEAKLSTLTNIQQTSAPAINSEIYLRKFYERFESNDIDQAQLFLEKAAAEITNINNKNFKLSQEIRLSEAQALLIK
ncbi:MAG: hypothetical protein K0S34_1850, partial [Bacillales bacterium]|nr:hypothetical protein [Bacillales bacterium]